jgi:hypothetical protein
MESRMNIATLLATLHTLWGESIAVTLTRVTVMAPTMKAQAVQVADPRHVLKKLGEPVPRVLTRERARVEQAAHHLQDQQIGHPEGSSTSSSLLSSREGTEIEQHRANRNARSCAVKRLLDRRREQAKP